MFRINIIQRFLIKKTQSFLAILMDFREFFLFFVYLNNNKNSRFVRRQLK